LTKKLSIFLLRPNSLSDQAGLLIKPRGPEPLDWRQTCRVSIFEVVQRHFCSSCRFGGVSQRQTATSAKTEILESGIVTPFISLQVYASKWQQSGILTAWPTSPDHVHILPGDESQDKLAFCSLIDEPMKLLALHICSTD